jgi:hypothetical protein
MLQSVPDGQVNGGLLLVVAIHELRTDTNFHILLVCEQGEAKGTRELY